MLKNCPIFTKIYSSRVILSFWFAIFERSLFFKTIPGYSLCSFGARPIQERDDHDDQRAWGWGNAHTIKELSVWRSLVCTESPTASSLRCCNIKTLDLLPIEIIIDGARLYINQWLQRQHKVRLLDRPPWLFSLLKTGVSIWAHIRNEYQESADNKSNRSAHCKVGGSNSLSLSFP